MGAFWCLHSLSLSVVMKSSNDVGHKLVELARGERCTSSKGPKRGRTAHSAPKHAAEREMVSDRFLTSYHGEEIQHVKHRQTNPVSSYQILPVLVGLLPLPFSLCIKHFPSLVYCPVALLLHHLLARRAFGLKPMTNPATSNQGRPQLV